MKKHIQYEYYLNREKSNIRIFDDIRKSALNDLADLKKGIHSMGEYIKNENSRYLELVKGHPWEKIIRIDLEKAILYSIVLLTHFILELQQVKVPALLPV